MPAPEILIFEQIGDELYSAATIDTVMKITWAKRDYIERLKRAEDYGELKPTPAEFLAEIRESNALHQYEGFEP